MKIMINKAQKIKAIVRVLNAYPLAFANKPQALAMKQALSDLSDEISNLISKLLRPASTIHRPKQDSQQKYSASLLEFIGMGILLATHLEDVPLLDILKVYKGKMPNVSAYKLYEIGVHVAEELEKKSELGVDFGLTAEKLTAFSTQTTDFGETLDITGSLLTDRKSKWKDLRKLLVTSSKIIRLKLDPYIEFNEKDFPELFKEYMLVRGSRKRTKKAVPADEATGEFSGTITDSVTGLPIENATINLIEKELVCTTDADGYYLIDELEESAYTITCFATGYVIPDSLLSHMAKGESLVVDFSLVPITPPIK